MKTGRLRRYGLRSGLLPSRAQPVKRSRGATQHRQRRNADCCLQAHALCATPPLNLLLVHRASVVQYLSVRGNYPASLAGSPRTISVSKRGPVVFPWLALLAAVGTRRWQKRWSAAWRPQGQGGFPKCATSSRAAPVSSAQTRWTNLCVAAIAWSFSTTSLPAGKTTWQKSATRLLSAKAASRTLRSGGSSCTKRNTL